MRTAKSNAAAVLGALVLGTTAGTPTEAQATDPASQSTPGRSAASSQSGMEAMDHSRMDHSKTHQPTAGQAGTGQPAMDHSGMNHASRQQMQGGEALPQPGQVGAGAAMAGMHMGPMQGGSAPADARDPDAYAEGTRHANLPGNEMNDEARFGRILLDKLEYAKGDGENAQSIDLEAWYGNDWDKLWVKADGERSGGRLQSLRKEALWDHAIAPFWSSQIGLRHDTGGGHARTWAAFGVRGLAPYWFDTTATAYLGSSGALAARINVRYELLFTQRLILDPEFEANLYSKHDPARGVGSGLSDLSLALRLRYEIRRQFAPYIGATWARSVGETADLAKARGERTSTAQVVAGVRIWF